MKKILVFTNHFYPESFRVNDLCKALVENGFEVTVATQIPNYPIGRYFDDYSLSKNRESIWQGVKIKRLWCIPRGNNSIGLLLNYLSYWLSTFIFSLFHKGEYDSVMAYMTSPIFMVSAAQRISRKAKAKMILYVLDIWPDNFYSVLGLKPSFLTKPLDTYCKNRYLRNDLVLVSSLTFIDKIKEITHYQEIDFGYLPQHGEDVYMPINRPESFNYFDREMLNVTFTGNVGKAQGLDFLIDAAKTLSARKEFNIRFNIVGEGSYLATLKNLVIQSDTSNYFNFIGRVPIEKISNILSETDLGLISFDDSPIYYMTIPAKLQSYLATGTPVITYGGGELNRLVESENLGFATKRGDVDDFVNNLSRFKEMDLASKDLYNENTRKYFDENFSKKVIVSQLINYLKRGEK